MFKHKKQIIMLSLMAGCSFGFIGFYTQNTNQGLSNEIFSTTTKVDDMDYKPLFENPYLMDDTSSLNNGNIPIQYAKFPTTGPDQNVSLADMQKNSESDNLWWTMSYPVVINHSDWSNLFDSDLISVGSGLIDDELIYNDSYGLKYNIDMDYNSEDDITFQYQIPNVWYRGVDVETITKTKIIGYTYSDQCFDKYCMKNHYYTDHGAFHVRTPIWRDYNEYISHYYASGIIGLSIDDSFNTFINANILNQDMMNWNNLIKIDEVNSGTFLKGNILNLEINNEYLKALMIECYNNAYLQSFYNMGFKNGWEYYDMMNVLNALKNFEIVDPNYLIYKTFNHDYSKVVIHENQKIDYYINLLNSHQPINVDNLKPILFHDLTNQYDLKGDDIYLFYKLKNWLENPDGEITFKMNYTIDDATSDITFNLSELVNGLVEINAGVSSEITINSIMLNSPNNLIKDFNIGVYDAKPHSLNEPYCYKFGHDYNQWFNFYQPTSIVTNEHQLTYQEANAKYNNTLLANSDNHLWDLNHGKATGGTLLNDLDVVDNINIKVYNSVGEVKTRTTYIDDKYTDFTFKGFKPLINFRILFPKIDYLNILDDLNNKVYFITNYVDCIDHHVANPIVKTNLYQEEVGQVVEDITFDYNASSESLQAKMSIAPSYDLNDYLFTINLAAPLKGAANYWEYIVIAISILMVVGMIVIGGLYYYKKRKQRS